MLLICAIAELSAAKAGENGDHNEAPNNNGETCFISLLQHIEIATRVRAGGGGRGESGLGEGAADPGDAVDGIVRVRQVAEVGRAFGIGDAGQGGGVVLVGRGDAVRQSELGQAAGRVVVVARGARALGDRAQAVEGVVLVANGGDAGGGHGGPPGGVVVDIGDGAGGGGDGGDAAGGVGLVDGGGVEGATR